ncbi:hypothetical protein OIU78_023814 [Salix suchowensis]|nr:hypothetical protein OIU78_023814 [Salix suchowensis]KAJ6295860.1 hypothetical protein OIU78_023814 [Salix suchowensis]
MLATFYVPRIQEIYVGVEFCIHKLMLCCALSGNPNLIMFLVGNKVDLQDKRKVGIEDGEQYAKENGMVFLETSAKSTHNVNELFYEIAKRLAKKAPSRPIGMKLQRRPQETGRRMFCCS